MPWKDGKSSSDFGPSWILTIFDVHATDNTAQLGSVEVIDSLNAYMLLVWLEDHIGVECPERK